MFTVLTNNTTLSVNVTLDIIYTANYIDYADNAVSYFSLLLQCECLIVVYILDSQPTTILTNHTYFTY